MHKGVNDMRDIWQFWMFSINNSYITEKNEVEKRLVAWKLKFFTRDKRNYKVRPSPFRVCPSPFSWNGLVRTL